MKYVEMLTEADLEFGARLWHALRNSKEIPLKGMLWLLHGDPGDWRLLVVSPIVSVLGPRDTLVKLTEITRDIPAEMSQLLTITPISPTNPVYQALHSVFGQTASVEGTRLANTMVDGVFIDEAYLYEIK